MPCHRGTKHRHSPPGVQKSLKNIKASAGPAAVNLQQYVVEANLGHLIKKRK